MIDLTPWTSGDEAAQEDKGWEEGYQDGLRGGGRDGDADTPYMRGYRQGYHVGELERQELAKQHREIVVSSATPKGAERGTGDERTG